jgi:hypothetical protein
MADEFQGTYVQAVDQHSVMREASEEIEWSWSQ